MSNRLLKSTVVIGLIAIALGCAGLTFGLFGLVQVMWALIMAMLLGIFICWGIVFVSLGRLS